MFHLLILPQPPNDNLSYLDTIVECQISELSMQSKLAQIGPPGSIKVCPLPSILGDTVNIFTIFSWSMEIAPIAYVE